MGLGPRKPTAAANPRLRRNGACHIRMNFHHGPATPSLWIWLCSRVGRAAEGGGALAKRGKRPECGSAAAAQPGSLTGAPYPQAQTPTRPPQSPLPKAQSLMPNTPHGRHARHLHLQPLGRPRALWPRGRGGAGRARRAQGKTGERFDRVLTELGIVPERALAGAVAHVLGLPLAEATAFPDAPLLAGSLPSDFLARARLMPDRARGEAPDARHGRSLQRRCRALDRLPHRPGDRPRGRRRPTSRRPSPASMACPRRAPASTATRKPPTPATPTTSSG